MRHPIVPLPPHPKARPLAVFRSRDFRVIEGVNEGDPLTDARDLQHEDVYALRDRATPVWLAVLAGAGMKPLYLGRDSATGVPGARLYLDCLLTFLAPAGDRLDALVFVEVDTEGLVAEVYLHPLGPLARAQGYALVTIDRDGAAARFAGFESPPLADVAPTLLVDGPRWPGDIFPSSAPVRSGRPVPQGPRPSQSTVPGIPEVSS